MAQSLFVHETHTTFFRTAHDEVDLRTDRSFQLVDISVLVEERVRRSGVLEGTVTVQSRHTTAAVIVAENERGLLADIEGFLCRLAPQTEHWQHDDLALRETPVALDEPRNGHAHARALLLPVSVTLVVAEGRLARGRFQGVFLVELDGPRARSLSIQVVGAAP